MLLQCLPSSSGSIPHMVWEEMSFEEFQDGRHGSHLGYGNRTILVILYNTPKPPFKFQLNLAYCLGLNVIWRISRWPKWWPSWISEWNDYSNSESLCHCDASHQVLAQSNFRFGRRCRLKNFKMAAVAWWPSWIWNGTILAILNLCVTVMLPIKFGSIQLTVWKEMSFEEFQDGRHGYQNRTILAILKLDVTTMPPIKFQLNLTYGFGGDIVWRISRWPPCGHLGYQNGPILAILNLCVTVMLPIKFWLNLT